MHERPLTLTTTTVRALSARILAPVIGGLGNGPNGPVRSVAACPSKAPCG